MGELRWDPPPPIGHLRHLDVPFSFFEFHFFDPFTQRLCYILVLETMKNNRDAISYFHILFRRKIR
jgi:hypothetical protein